MELSVEENIALSKTCAALLCIRDYLAELEDSDNKAELVNWLDISTQLLKGVVLDGCTIIENIDEQVSSVVS